MLAPVLGEGAYSVIQAVAMTWDIRTGNWYEPELELLKVGLRSGETAIDVGGNFGLYAYHMSRAVEPTGKVYSFEPIPFTARTFRLIQRALRFGHNVELVNAGCGDKPGRVSFTVPVMDTGAINAGRVHMGRNDARDGKDRYANYKTKVVECEVVTLDERLAGVKNTTMLKCDIEGADLFAMRGAKQLLAEQHPTVIIEITPWYLEGFGLSVRDVTSFFEDLGYRCYRYVDGKLWPATAETIEEGNWVFIHDTYRSRFDALLTTN
jgi:FkbM family methyltransferase